MYSILNLPYDMIFIIFTQLKNLKQYKIVNKNILKIIDSIFSYFTSMYSKLEQNWESNPISFNNLISKLVKINNIDGLIFLINNYNNKYYLVDRIAAYYTGVYNNIEVIKIGLINDFKNNIINGAAQGNNYELIKRIFDENNGRVILKNAVIISIDYKNFELTKKLLELAIFPFSHKYINIFATRAASVGNLDLVKYLFENYHATNVTGVGVEAASKKYSDIVLWAFNRGANLTDIAVSAVENANDIETLNWAYSVGFVDPNDIAYAAATIGNLEVLTDSLTRGANINNFMIMKRAVIFQNFDFVKTLVEMGANDFQIMAEAASFANKLDIYKYAIEKSNGNLSYYEIAISAVRGGNIDLVKNILTNHIIRRYRSFANWLLTITSLNRSYISKIEKLAYLAAKCNHLDILKYLISLGAQNFDSLVKVSIKNNNLEIIKYLVENKMYEDYNKIAELAIKNNNLNCLEYSSSKNLNIVLGDTGIRILIYALEKGVYNYGFLKALALKMKNVNAYEIIKYFEKRSK